MALTRILVYPVARGVWQETPAITAECECGRRVTLGFGPHRCGCGRRYDSAGVDQGASHIAPPPHPGTCVCATCDATADAVWALQHEEVSS